MPEDEDTALPSPLMASPIQPIIEEDSEDLDTTAEEAETTTTMSNNNLFDSENPWDLVPDQPAKVDQPAAGIKTTKVEIIGRDDDWPVAQKNNGQNLMDDPFDADWVSLALKSSTSNNESNP